MFSKGCAVFLLFLVTIISLSCARENEDFNSPIKFSLKGGADCLSRFDEHLSDFVEGRKTNEQIDQFWGCISKAVRDYQRLTSGEGHGDRYDPQAVARFIEKFFMKSGPLSDSLLDSVMEVKRVFLSGSNDYITDAELNRLYSLLDLVNELSQEVNPHLRVLLFKNVTASDEQIEAAHQALTAALARLGRWLEDQDQPYTFAELEKLVTELGLWIADGGDVPEIIGHLKTAIKIFVPVKALLISGDPQGIGSGREWSALMTSIVENYHVVLAGRYAFELSIDAGLIRKALPQSLMSVATSLTRGLYLRPQQRIALTEVDRLFTEIEKSGWLPGAFTQVAMSRAFSWVVTRMLGKSGEAQEYLTPKHIGELRHHLKKWLTWHQDSAKPKELRQVLAQSPPMEWDEVGRLVFGARPVGEWSEDGRRHMVWPTILLGWLKDSFFGKQVTDLDLEHMTLIAEEMLPVLKGFGWLESTEATIGNKLLRESDLFTYSSNGDGKMQMHEAVRYLAFVASSLRMSEIWLGGSDPHCPQREADCVRQYAADPTHQVFEAMPGLASFFSGKQKSAWVQFQKDLEEISMGEVVEETISTGELLKSMIVVHYIETFMRRYDRDDSTTINLQESVLAYRVFNGLLGGILIDKGFPEEEVLPFFTFLMKYGDTPITMFGAQVAWLHWRWHQDHWAFEADRARLKDILYQLSKL